MKLGWCLDGHHSDCHREFTFNGKRYQCECTYSNCECNSNREGEEK